MKCVEIGFKWEKTCLCFQFFIFSICFFFLIFPRFFFLFRAFHFHCRLFWTSPAKTTQRFLVGGKSVRRSINTVITFLDGPLAFRPINKNLCIYVILLYIILSIGPYWFLLVETDRFILLLSTNIYSILVYQSNLLRRDFISVIRRCRSLLVKSKSYCTITTFKNIIWSR